MAVRGSRRRTGKLAAEKEEEDGGARRSIWAPVRPECTLSRKSLRREERAEEGQEEAGISAATAPATA